MLTVANASSSDKPGYPKANSTASAILASSSKSFATATSTHKGSAISLRSFKGLRMIIGLLFFYFIDFKMMQTHLDISYQKKVVMILS